MGFDCPECGASNAVQYANANESRCVECGTLVPNAHLVRNGRRSGV